MKNATSKTTLRGTSQITDEDLRAILSKLSRIESVLVDMQTKEKETKKLDTQDEVLLVKLGQLTLKRHAVLTASLAEVSYHTISELMQCSETTVKLHLKAAMDLLGIPDRSSLLVSHKHMLDPIPNDVYVQRFGISKTWWMEDNKNLMAVLTSTKPPANQHTKETT